ncbi:hypothetical protein NA56DRAFT_702676 [Hyaloscypha hepaticicola]|uniref:Uncharacterized protein n=1 Tax=Hyaloscypha hepaticicola TaxID=2082293 RepID=A0A2J6Q7R0_9HELO|nr:hypothetical protein NA56DRAFT_702676 [Hyaloscypha hepaticicola]
MSDRSSIATSFKGTPIYTPATSKEASVQDDNSGPAVPPKYTGPDTALAIFRHEFTTMPNEPVIDSYIASLVFPERKRNRTINMSDWSLLSGDGDATSTNSDGGFAMVNHSTISTATARVPNANVATWLQTQLAVDAPIETSVQNNDVSPYASKATINTATIANQVETVPNPFKDDE